MGSRVKGSNKHGFKNEKLIVKALNKKRLKDLNPNLKKFVKDICEDNKISFSDDMVIECEIEKNNNYKQDFYITVEGNKFGISMKMGTGNSVHQEKIEDFIEWISKNSRVKMTREIKDSLRFFSWADGSVDGSAKIERDDHGNIIGRFGTREFKKNFPQKRKQIQEFLQNNAYIIINKVIFVGKYNSNVQYVYHGTPSNGSWLSKDEIIDYHIKNTKLNDAKIKAAIIVGRLTVQPWNP